MWISCCFATFSSQGGEAQTEESNHKQTQLVFVACVECGKRKEEGFLSPLCC